METDNNECGIGSLSASGEQLEEVNKGVMSNCSTGQRDDKKEEIPTSSNIGDCKKSELSSDIVAGESSASQVVEISSCSIASEGIVPASSEAAPTDDMVVEVETNKLAQSCIIAENNYENLADNIAGSEVNSSGSETANIPDACLIEAEKSLLKAKLEAYQRLINYHVPSKLVY